MAVEIVTQHESEPASWPEVTGLSEQAGAIDPAPVWARIEAWTAVRFAPRSVVWTLEGSGRWVPPLSPVEIDLAELWGSTGWEPAEIRTAPYGFDLAPGTWRISATVGGGDLPPAVAEAFRRLAEYVAAPQPMGARPGVTLATMNVGGELTVTHRRSAEWLARALFYSGAGDLLRPYRRAS